MYYWLLILQWRSLRLYSQFCWALSFWFSLHLVYTALWDGASGELAMMDQLCMIRQHHSMASVYWHFTDVNADLFHLFVIVIWLNTPPVLTTLLRWSVQISLWGATGWSVVVYMSDGVYNVQSCGNWPSGDQDLLMIKYGQCSICRFDPLRKVKNLNSLLNPYKLMCNILS